MVLIQVVDIRKEAEAKTLFAKVKNELGAVDVLVNNSGSAKTSLPLKDVSADDFWLNFIFVSRS
jgi:NADP-dependent 3-hydroxy acid dehydrogenase YdfG